MQRRLLTILLLTASFAWAISVVGVFAPWQWAVVLMHGLGAGPIPEDPMLNYWLRMAAGAFTGIGVLFFVMALRPHDFSKTIPWAGGLMFTEGIVLAVSGALLRLPAFPFFADTACCLLVGGGIFALSVKGLNSRV